jgi:hypothetical protein
MPDVPPHNMNRNLIIVIVAVVFCAIVVAAATVVFKKNPSSTQTFRTGSRERVVVTPHIVSALAADAPRGSTFSLQGKNGAVTVNNIYKTAVGYWPEWDALVLENNASDIIWYYRSSGAFEIALSANGIVEDEKTAESRLMKILGVDVETFCGLFVSASYPMDGGAGKQDIPINVCSSVIK